MVFTDRTDAGKRLAHALAHLKNTGVVVLGLPRGGVPVAFEVAKGLEAPLDVIVVRKLGMPFQPELAMGAVSEEGALVIDYGLVQSSGVSKEQLHAIEVEQRAEVEARVRRFRGTRQRLDVAARHVVIVDDGLATGATAAVACQVVRDRGAAKITLAVPVCSVEAAEKLEGVADEVVCLERPTPFYAVGQYYADFTQTSDGEVVRLLSKRAAELQKPGSSGDSQSEPGSAQARTSKQ